MSEDSIKITILNWEKINPRTDVKHPSWFKFKHKFFEDPDFYHFTPSERLIWVYLLCESSKVNKNGEFTVNFQHAHRMSGVTLTEVYSSIEKLKQLRIIETRTLRGRYVDVHNPGDRLDKNRLEEIRKEKKDTHTLAKHRVMKSEEREEPNTAEGVCVILDLWERFRGNLAPADFTGGRRALLVQAWREKPEAQYWETVFKKVAASEFLTGGSDRGWKATLGWILKDARYSDVMEGAFDKHEKSANQETLEEQAIRIFGSTGK